MWWWWWWWWWECVVGMCGECVAWRCVWWGAAMWRWWKVWFGWCGVGDVANGICRINLPHPPNTHTHKHKHTHKHTYAHGRGKANLPIPLNHHYVKVCISHLATKPVVVGLIRGSGGAVLYMLNELHVGCPYCCLYSLTLSCFHNTFFDYHAKYWLTVINVEATNIFFIHCFFLFVFNCIFVL